MQPILVHPIDREPASAGRRGLKPLVFIREISEHLAENSRTHLRRRAGSAWIWMQPLTRKAGRTFRGWGSAWAHRSRSI